MLETVSQSPALRERPDSLNRNRRLTPVVREGDSIGQQRLQGTVVNLDSTAEKSGEVHALLVQRIAIHQDRAAFQQLFAHFAPRVKSYLMGFNLDSERAEDLVQDIMVTLWQKAGQYDPEKARVSTWIFRIARNRFIDQTRKHKYPEVNADDHLGDMEAPEQTDQPLQVQETADRIASALTVLNEDQRQVIDLSFFKEMSHSEIADHLSLPLGTVKSRIRLAFQTMRKELEEI